MKEHLRIATGNSGRAWPSLRGLLLNLFVCGLIATVITLVAGGGQFLDNFLLSLCIGYSVYFSNYAAFFALSPRVPAPVLVVFGVLGGLAIGLLLAGTLLLDRPLYFFRGQYEVLVLGVLFGVVATAGFLFLGDLLDVRARLGRAEREALERDKAMAEAELRVLQAQIEPHFLFNTLANVISLIDDEPARARQLLERLTSLLRISLARTRADAVTLADGLSVVRDYLQIQAIRMDGRLAWDVQMDAALSARRVPPLLVQPLVENAVLHGCEPKAEVGSVAVIVAAHGNGALQICVEDDGVGMLNATGGAGTGLANVRERLRAVYGEQANLRLIERPEGGVRAELSIPAEDA